VYHLGPTEFDAFIRCGWCALDARLDIEYWHKLESTLTKMPDSSIIYYDPLDNIPIDITIIANVSKGKAYSSKAAEITQKWEIAPGQVKTIAELASLPSATPRVAANEKHRREQEKYQQSENDRIEKNRIANQKRLETRQRNKLLRAIVTDDKKTKKTSKLSSSTSDHKSTSNDSGSDLTSMRTTWNVAMQKLNSMLDSKNSATSLAAPLVVTEDLTKKLLLSKMSDAEKLLVESTVKEKEALAATKNKFATQLELEEAAKEALIYEQKLLLAKDNLSRAREIEDREWKAKQQREAEEAAFRREQDALDREAKRQKEFFQLKVGSTKNYMNMHQSVPEVDLKSLSTSNNGSSSNENFVSLPKELLEALIGALRNKND
jgi:hypothetical protein